MPVSYSYSHNHVANTSRHVMHAATSSYVASIQAHNSGCLAILCAIATH